MMNLSSLSKAKFLSIAVSLLAVADIYLISIEGNPGWQLLPAFLSLIISLCIRWYLQRMQKSIEKVSKGCVQLAHGNFETRILDIKENGDMGELFHHINDMTDVMDAFVRESTACMQAVNENRYYRNIMPEGLQGDLSRGSHVINQALENIGQKTLDFSDVAKAVDASLNNVADEITTTISSLNETAQNMERSVQQAYSRTRDVVQAAEETALSVNTISSASEEMSVSISEISHQISKSSQITDAAVENAKNAKSCMEELAKTVEKITSVVTLIEDIAAQTNLLALNATIEAARAGESGKGFAVVANEVKTLAAQTTEATETIRLQIKDVQFASETSLESFAGISRSINDISHYTANISAAIEEQSTASREIALSTQRASQGTSIVSRNIVELGADIELVSGAAASVMEITRTLSENTIVNVRQLVEKMNEFMGKIQKVL